MNEMITSATEPRYAGFWIRFVAALLDQVILWIPLSLVMDMVFPSSFVEIGGVERPIINPVSFFIQIAAAIAYYGYFYSGKWQATIGKRIVGIYVIRSTGESISFLRGVGRYFAQIVSAFTLGVGYIMAGFSKEKTALHDLICDTRVVYGKK